MCANAIYSLLPTGLQSEVKVLELYVADYQCWNLERLEQKLYIYMCDMS